jgi:D-lactate dehydrogenase (cytochrome)
MTAAFSLTPLTLSRTCSRDGKRYHGQSSVVARPKSVQEIKSIVEVCIEDRISIVPQGGNTGLCGGAVSESGQLVLSLERLNQIREIDSANNTITVEAGCILANIQNTAQEARRFFPVSLAAEGSCQIGGNLATNAGGINVLRYGNTREQVLGLEAILPNGSLFSDLAGLRKDNTGYDLKQLLIGSEGTLGIITAATLKLYPYPDHSVTAFVALKDLETSISFLALATELSGGTLCSFELIPHIGLEFACRHISTCESPLSSEHDWYVLLSLQTSGSTINLDETLEALLESALEAHLIDDAVLAANEAQAARLWKIREGIVEGQLFEGGSIKHDISIPVSKVPRFITEASKAVSQRIPGIRPCPFGHVGDGNIHFNLSQPGFNGQG